MVNVHKSELENIVQGRDLKLQARGRNHFIIRKE